MKKELSQKIEIPEEVEITIKDNEITIKGPEGETKREFNLGKVNISKKEDEIILECKKATKREKKIMNTTKAHLLNMIKGCSEKFEYKLKICSSHFPMTVKIDEGKAIIKNFLGEKIDRKVKIPKNVEVKIDKDFITINSLDKEDAGQTAANFESATKIRKRDNRIFQDGIYIINKAGRDI